MIVYVTEYIGNNNRQRKLVERLDSMLQDIEKEQTSHKKRRNHYMRVSLLDGVLIAVSVASVAYFGWNLLLRIGPSDNRAKHLELELWGGPKMSDLIDKARGELKHEVAHDD